MSGSPVDVAELRSVEVLSDVADLEPLAVVLERRHLEASEPLMAAGDDADFFALVTGGELDITAAAGQRVAVAEAGSIVGELGLASERPRRASAVARVPSSVLVGDHAAFETLLHLPGVGRRVRDLAAARLAANAEPVATTLRSGREVLLRPLLGADRPAFAAAITKWSAESLRRRFFTAVRPSDELIDYLVHVDYVDHFAWVVADAAAPDTGLATARYIRDGDDHALAEVAFGVDEGQRGQGLGTLLLGALAVAAGCSGIERFEAEMLVDNVAMRAVFAKAAAELHTIDGETVAVELEVARARRLIDARLAGALAGAVGEVVTAAGLALVVP